MFTKNSNFNFEQYTNFKNQFNANTKNLNIWIKDWCYRKAKETITKAKDRTPVDTGLLLASWKEPTIKISGNIIEITFKNDAYYAGWVEYGHNTRGHAGEPVGGVNWVEGRFMLTVPLQDLQRDVYKEFGPSMFAYITKNYI